jgi:hypothetical protein
LPGATHPSLRGRKINQIHIFNTDKYVIMGRTFARKKDGVIITNKRNIA